ncbi:hypothetical protein [Crystallibacter degradans]|nr:hypothetical protein [Arthrobacter sp. SF27]
MGVLFALGAALCWAAYILLLPVVPFTLERLACAGSPPPPSAR